MYSNFDCQEAVEKIKSALYDIYESQEVMIGEEEDVTKRNDRVEKYIKTKDFAVQLLESIESLYNIKNKVSKADNNASSEPRIIEPQIVQDSKQDELLKEGNQIEDVGIVPELTEKEKEEENHEEIDVITDTSLFPIFYLDSRNGNKPNFAFVPKSIFLKLKENGILELVNNRLYKQDSEEKRGIIVRKDQFMKLSLSRDRQEGVLIEAKQFRIKQARKSRERLQNI